MVSVGREHGMQNYITESKSSEHCPESTGASSQDLTVPICRWDSPFKSYLSVRPESCQHLLVRDQLMADARALKRNLKSYQI